MNESDYLLAKACISAVFASLMNAYTCRENEWDANRHFKQADLLENKFKTKFGLHPLTYVETYEKSKRLHPD